MRIAALQNVPGLVAAALVGPDGLALDRLGDGGDILAAELAAMRAALERSARRLGSGEITRLAYTTERVEVFAVMKDQFTLGVAMARGQDQRLAQQTIAQIIRDLQLPQPEQA